MIQLVLSWVGLACLFWFIVWLEAWMDRDK